MNKTAIKNFAIWSRNKLIADISYRAGLMGITEDGIHSALPQSTGKTEFYDIGTAEPYAITGEAIRQRRHLVELIQRKEKDTDYKTAYKYIIEEVAYTWFNRLIAIRFMEVNDYLPSHIRVLSSDSGKLEPDLVTTPFDADLVFTRDEQQTVLDLKNANKLDEVFRLLFIKQCNTLNEILPALFEKTNDYTELLLNLSVIDQDGVVYHLVHDIPEEDFDVERGGQVEIIGWLYQFYNTEPKNDSFALLKKNIKVSKERIPTVTQLFTPDWIVRYMVENSLGRLWVEGHPNNDLKAGWKYYLEEVEQDPEVQEKLAGIRKEYATLIPEDIKLIDPCMGSGHILVYAFDVLMQIYESAGYGQRDAARSIIENNLYGLDIDDRAFQMAYFAIMMKARQYNRRILNGEYKPNLCSIQESKLINRNHLKYFGAKMSELDKKKAITQLNDLLDTFDDAKEYGSILSVDQKDWRLLYSYVSNIEPIQQLSFDAYGVYETREKLLGVINQGKILSEQYEVVVTNPPYMSSSSMNNKLLNYVKKEYKEGKSDMSTVMMIRCRDFTKQYGFLAMINIPVWMFISSYSNLRQSLLRTQTIENMLHFGRGVFGSDFGTTSFVIRKGIVKDYKALYRKLYIEVGNVDSLDQKEKWFFDGTGRYETPQTWFDKIPTTPIAYWLSEKAVSLFVEKPALGTVADPRQGLATGNDAKYLRSWSEVEFNKIEFGAENVETLWEHSNLYAPFNKGGAFRKWYGNNNLVIRFNKTCYQELLKSGNHLPSRQLYFKEGITWSALTAGDFSGRYCKKGFVFAGKGPMCFPNNKDDLFYLLAFLNSKVTSFYMKVFSSTTDFNQGPMRDLPIIMDCNKQREKVEHYVKECIGLSKQDWDEHETSWDFQLHPIVAMGNNVEDGLEKWTDVRKDRFQRMKEIEVKINEILISIYGLDEELKANVDEKNISLYKIDRKEDIKSLLSYAVGCIFGRYSLDCHGIAFAGGIWNQDKYKTFTPDEDAIIPITDEEYLKDDILTQLCTWLKAAFGENCLEDNLDYIAASLGSKNESSRETIRRYFINDFFKDHCSKYSYGTLGKKPIYWQFESGKQNGFKALIYMHRYTENTIGDLRIDYLHRMQRVYESEISRMQDMIDYSTDVRGVAQATKRREKLTRQLKECREYDEKISHLALARISIDLDDGVKNNLMKIQTALDGKKYSIVSKV